MKTSLLTLLLLYALWMLFLAVMNLRAAKERGTLPKAALVLALPVVALAVLLDVVVNATLGTLIFLDLPKEWTLSERLSRYLPLSTWRGVAALWIGAALLDPFDPSGSHLKRPT